MSRIFTGVRARWLPLYDALKSMAERELGVFEEHETSGAVLWKHSSAFAEVSAKKDAMVVAFASDTLHDEWEPAKALQTSKKRVVHYFEVTDDSEFPELTRRIKAAYELTKTGRPLKREPKTGCATVDEYIGQFSPERQEVLRKIRQVIQKAAPDAEERTSWAMPTYWQGENLVHFSDAKHHVGFHPSPEAIIAFDDKLAGYRKSKGTVQFPYAQPIPYDLIEEITRWRVKQMNDKHGK